jgi:CelD/BcsL family acetyltransferase involved in cellulose biosynthesis
VATQSDKGLGGAATAHDGQLTELRPSDPRWTRFVEEHPDALAFHGAPWMDMIAECYGFRPFVLAKLGGNGAMLGGLPVMEVRHLRRRPRWVALPFSDVCNPLLSADVSSEAFTDALDHARRDAGIGDFHVRAPLADATNVHFGMNAVVHATVLHPDPGVMFKRFHRSQVQRNVRRAERDKVTVRRADRASDLATYYHLQVQTRRRHGMPVQPRRFFEALWTHVLEPGHGTLLLAYADGQPVAGCVTVAGTETMTYKYGASDSHSWKLRPNHLLLWHALRSACEDGYRIFDFGRSDLDGSGLREFKSGWDAREIPLITTTLADHAPVAGSGRGLAAMQAVLRHSPSWACRGIGEVLYRYTA